MSNITTSVDTKNIVFEKLAFYARMHLDESFMADNLEFEQYLDHITQNLVIDLRTRVLAHNFDDHKRRVTLDFSVEIPATWWDMFKQDLFPNWLQARFPVRIRTITKTRSRTVSFKKYATFPDAPPLPKESWFWPVGYQSFTSEDLEDDESIF